MHRFGVFPVNYKILHALDRNLTGEDLFHAPPVLLEGHPPRLCEVEPIDGLLFDELLLDFQVAGLLKPGHVRGEVSEGEAGLAHQEQEIGALDDVEPVHIENIE